MDTIIWRIVVDQIFKAKPDFLRMPYQVKTRKKLSSRLLSPSRHSPTSKKPRLFRWWTNFQPVVPQGIAGVNMTTFLQEEIRQGFTERIVELLVHLELGNHSVPKYA